MCALEAYAPRHRANFSSLEGRHDCSGSLTHRPVAERVSTCGEDEDSMSMALTVVHRLMHRCNVQLSEVGALHVAVSPLDRSKSAKTELMALLKAGNGADTEGVDHCGASRDRLLALLSCNSWAQSDSWDGRWAVAVCSVDNVVETSGKKL